MPLPVVGTRCPAYLGLPSRVECQLLQNSYFSVGAHGTPFGDCSAAFIAHSYLPEAYGNPG